MQQRDGRITSAITRVAHAELLPRDEGAPQPCVDIEPSLCWCEHERASERPDKRQVEQAAELPAGQHGKLVDDDAAAAASAAAKPADEQSSKLGGLAQVDRSVWSASRLLAAKLGKSAQRSKQPTQQYEWWRHYCYGEWRRRRRCIALVEPREEPRQRSIR